jgi:hypothetical protein
MRPTASVAPFENVPVIVPSGPIEYASSVPAARPS